jgi:hypothetical protein
VKEMNKKNENTEVGGTRLEGKHFSPLTIRKYTRPGNPLFVAIITDDSLEDLDNFILNKFGISTMGQELEEIRQQVGKLTEALKDHYVKAEGVAVIFYADKAMISSLWGDFMNHFQCKYELYSLLQIATNV